MSFGTILFACCQDCYPRQRDVGFCHVSFWGVAPFNGGSSSEAIDSRECQDTVYLGRFTQPF